MLRMRYLFIMTSVSFWFCSVFLYILGNLLTEEDGKLCFSSILLTLCSIPTWLRILYLLCLYGQRKLL